MSLETYIKTNVNKLSNKVYIAPDIPSKKLNAAITAMTDGPLNPDYVLAIVDTSLFGSAKDGCLITGDRIYIHALLSNKIEIKFDDIKAIEYIIQSSFNEKGKEIETEMFYVILEDSRKIDLSKELATIDMENLEKMLNYIISHKQNNSTFETSDQGTSKDETQTSPLADMNDDIKIAYLKLIINVILDEENITGNNIYPEVISLCVRNKVNKNNRLEIRNYLFEGKQVESNKSLLYALKNELTENDFTILKFSLLKDLISINRSFSFDDQEDFTWKNSPTIKSLAGALSIDDKQLGEIESSIIQSENILKNRQNDDQIKKGLTDMGARAAAVGVPLAALYFTGTTGVSAVGLTTGLAGLGMKGFLGLSPMVTGIGAVILVGVGTYSGLKKLIGITDLENNKTREVMLTEIIKNSQKSINILIEDVNEISIGLKNAIIGEQENKELIVDFADKLNMLSTNTISLQSKLEHAQRENKMLTLPLILDINRLRELTLQPTERKYYDVALEGYSEIIVPYERKIKDEVTGSDQNIIEKRTEYHIKENMPIEDLEVLNIIFEKIGYYKVADASMATVKGKAKGLLSKLEEFNNG